MSNNQNCTIKNVRLDSHFTTTPNKTWEDSRLSWDAKGLLSYLLSRPSDWKIKTWQLAQIYQGNKKGNGIDAIRSMLNELKEFGYVFYEKKKNSNGHWEHIYFVYPMPYMEFKKMFPEPVQPVPVKPDGVKPHIITNNELPRNELRKQQQPLTPSEKVVVVLPYDKFEKLYDYLEKFIRDFAHDWFIPKKSLLELIGEYGYDEVAKYVNYMCETHHLAIQQEKNPYSKQKTRPIDKPFTFLAKACKEKWKILKK